jgi:hypothetical protein
MKVTQTIETKYCHFYIGYGYCEFKDEAGNMVSVKLTDDNILDMYESVAYKRERILKQRAEEAAHIAPKSEESANE